MYLNIVHHNNQMHPVLIMARAMVKGPFMTMYTFVLRDKGIKKWEGVKRRIWI